MISFTYGTDRARLSKTVNGLTTIYTAEGGAILQTHFETKLRCVERCLSTYDNETQYFMIEEAACICTFGLDSVLA